MGIITAAGKIVIVGGENQARWEDGGGWITPSAWTFNPKTNRWQRLPDLHIERRGSGAATAGGRVYVLSGSYCPGVKPTGPVGTHTVESLPVSAVNEANRSTASATPRKTGGDPAQDLLDGDPAGRSTREDRAAGPIEPRATRPERVASRGWTATSTIASRADRDHAVARQPGGTAFERVGEVAVHSRPERPGSPERMWLQLVSVGTLSRRGCSEVLPDRGAAEQQRRHRGERAGAPGSRRCGAAAGLSRNCRAASHSVARPEDHRRVAGDRERLDIPPIPGQPAKTRSETTDKRQQAEGLQQDPPGGSRTAQVTSGSIGGSSMQPSAPRMLTEVVKRRRRRRNSTAPISA